MSQPIDRAYVELEARGTGDAVRDVLKALKEIQVAVDKATRSIENDFSDASRDIEKEMEEAGSILTKEAVKQRLEWKKTGESMGASIVAASHAATRAVDDFADDAVHDLERVSRQAKETAATVAIAGAVPHIPGNAGGGGGGGSSNVDVDVHRNPLTSITSGLGGALTAARAAIGDFFDEIFDGLSKVSGPLLNFGKTAVGVFSAVGSALSAAAIPTLIALAIPLVLALGGAVAGILPALLALPAAIAVLPAIFAPAIIAFQGMGDAIKAISSGDIDKIKKAMENLAPAAQNVAREIAGLLPQFKDLRKTVQQEFFAPMIGQFERLGKVLIPELKSGLSGVAGELGKFGSGLLELLGQNDILDVIGDVFASAQRIVANLSPKLLDFIGVMFGVVEHALPFVERAFAAFGGLLDRVGEWLSLKLSNGDFEKMLETAVGLLKSLGKLTASVGRFLGALFGGFNEEGKNFLDTLTGIVDGMTDWVKSAEGQDVLQKIIDNVPKILSALGSLLAFLGKILEISANIQDAFSSTWKAIKDAGTAVADFFSAIGEGASAAWTAVTGFFASVGSFFSSIGTWVSGAWTSIMGFFTQVGAWFAALPGQIMGFLAALPGNIVKFFADLASKMAYGAGYAVGAVIAFFRDLPAKITILLGQLLAAAIKVFNSVWNFMVTTASKIYSGVVNWFALLPGRINGLILQVVTTVVSRFTSAYNSAVSLARSLYTGVINWFALLPGRIGSIIGQIPGIISRALSSAASVASRIGSAIINGIANAIRNGIGYLQDMAYRAARSAVSGFMSALGIHSPSRVMQEEVGEPMVAGIGVGLKKGTRALKSELNAVVGDITPTTNTTAVPITLGAGAVQVTFSGVVPSAAEALRAGQAAGQGVLDALQRRAIRTAVRTV